MEYLKLINIINNMITEEQLNKLIKEKIDYTKFYVPPHKKISEPVTNNNLKIVIENAVKLVKMCLVGKGKYPSGFAIAHSQIEDKKPLRFFVMHTGELIINPVITRHTQHTVDSEEGCLSFENNPMVTIQRWNKIEVDYQTLNEKDKLTEILHKKLSGKESKIYQHEIDHMDGKNIYNI